MGRMNPAGMEFHLKKKNSNKKDGRFQFVRNVSDDRGEKIVAEIISSLPSPLGNVCLSVCLVFVMTFSGS